MLSDILSKQINEALGHVNYGQLNEIRMRDGKPLVVFLGGQAYFLGEKGLTSKHSEAIFGTKEMVSDVVFRASECSLYAVNEQLKRGFLTIAGGIRLGVAGEFVSENGIIKTVKNFSSLCIRIPHVIKNCSLTAFPFLVADNCLQNTLVISPPGAGKTTFVRDFVFQLSEHRFCANVLVLDERGELVPGGTETIGNFADVVLYSTKKDGFELGIRSLAPNLIVTDELGNDEDLRAIEYALNCGVKVMATTHADSLATLRKKVGFEKILKSKVFSRFVVLSCTDGPGTLDGIYNENFERLPC